MFVSIVGVLSTDVVGGARLHVVPENGPPASLQLPGGWQCRAGEIRDSAGALVARLGDRVTLTGEWIAGLVSMHGPSRVLQVSSMEPGGADPAQ